MSNIFLIISFIASLAYLIITFKKVKSMPTGNEKMKSIALAIREGAMAFLSREYKILLILVIIVAGVLGLAINTGIAFAFVLGAAFSALAGYIGMQIATLANIRTAQAARQNLSKALNCAFSSGTILSFSVVSLGLLGIFILFNFFGDTLLLFGFSFGASAVALFARVGGGIFTKAADVGADLVGKIEAGIPEDDPRNPAVIADNVGDNVGDIAGMGADLFESYVGSIIAAMALGAIAVQDSSAGMEYPLIIASLGIISSIIATFFVKAEEESKIHAALRNGLLISSGIVTLCALYFSQSLFHSLNPFFATLVGLVSGLLIGFITEYYTSTDYNPVKKIAESCQTGAATNIIEGFATGMISVCLPVIVIAFSIALSFFFAGTYGIALAAVGMLSTLGISLAVDAYGPVADNAGGIAEMSQLEPEVRKRTDALDAAGNTTAAIGKGFAIGSAALTALAFFSTFAIPTQLEEINIMEPLVIMGLFLGAMMPMLFSGLCIKAVGRSAFEMIQEVRRQFAETEGIMEGTTKPDYARCVDIATKSSLKEMVLPGVLAIVAPISVGLVFGPESLGGFLAGALTVGIVLAILMANSGGAWDNAKKYIEAGNFDGKGSEAHKAAVIGDTVGDPFKDTAGPSLNILIKLMSTTSLVFASLFV
jgi:K(+)-stimulated pyrophosphate-energized sodium pump